VVLVRELGEQHRLDLPTSPRRGDLQCPDQHRMNREARPGGAEPRGAPSVAQGGPVAEVDAAPREGVARRGPPRGAGEGRAAGEEVRGPHPGHDEHEEVVLQLRPRPRLRRRHGRMGAGSRRLGEVEPRANASLFSRSFYPFGYPTLTYSVRAQIFIVF
jgi:hypothetical protein